MAGLNKHSELPWGVCGEKSAKVCSCFQIWTADHPVAHVTNGKWGDDYPAIRLTSTNPLEAKVEAYMEMIEYGEIPLEVAEANARFIVTAVNAFGPMLEALKHIADNRVVLEFDKESPLMKKVYGAIALAEKSE